MWKRKALHNVNIHPSFQMWKYRNNRRQSYFSCNACHKPNLRVKRISILNTFPYYITMHYDTLPQSTLYNYHILQWFLTYFSTLFWSELFENGFSFIGIVLNEGKKNVFEINVYFIKITKLENIYSRSSLLRCSDFSFRFSHLFTTNRFPNALLEFLCGLGESFSIWLGECFCVAKVILTSM